MVDPYAALLDAKGQIRLDKVDDLLVEVVSGKYIFTQSESPFALYASRPPTVHEQDAGRVVFVRAMKGAIGRSRPLLPRLELEKLALENDLFIPNEREEKVNITAMMVRQQKAREKSTVEQQKAALAVEIEVGRQRLRVIEANEWQILQHAAEARAEEVRISYFVSCCTLCGELLDETVWKTWAEFQDSTTWSLYYDANNAFYRVYHGLPITIIKALARTTEWRIRWKSAKESKTSPFDLSSVNWDRNKVNLIYWSDFYDSIYQHPECPDDETIQSDEYLNNWLAGQVAKRNKERANMPIAGRKSPMYRDNPRGPAKPMRKIGADQKIAINTPYKIRT